MPGAAKGRVWVQFQGLSSAARCYLTLERLSFHPKIRLPLLCIVPDGALSLSAICATLTVYVVLVVVLTVPSCQDPAIHLHRAALYLVQGCEHAPNSRASSRTNSRPSSYRGRMASIFTHGTSCLWARISSTRVSCPRNQPASPVAAPSGCASTLEDDPGTACPLSAPGRWKLGI